MELSMQYFVEDSQVKCSKFCHISMKMYFIVSAPPHAGKDNKL